MSDTIDLRSDTITRPTPAMRQAMAEAEVGDDVFGEDPTVNALQQRVAQLLGKEAALFLPSGTMANLTAICAQTNPGDTVILSEDAHPFHYESGGMGMVAGVMTKLLPGVCGVMEPESVERAVVQSHDAHFSPTTLVSIEHTTNRGGGAVYPLKTIEAIRHIAQQSDMRIHCDGARIFNASVASGVSVADYAKHADTVSFCFSKGLGCPAGSILTGDSKTIRAAHRYRKMLGGGMRQAGILAAAAMYALDHHVERLADDHRRCRHFREALQDTPNIAFPLPSPTNILYLDVPDAYRFIAHIAAEDVYALPVAPTRVRVVFHLDIDDNATEKAITTFKEAAIRH